MRLTKSENARSKQLLVMPTESLTDREWQPGELLSGLKCSKARLVFRYEILDFFYDCIAVAIEVYFPCEINAAVFLSTRY